MAISANLTRLARNVTSTNAFPVSFRERVR